MAARRTLSYQKALAGLYSLDRFGSRPGLERIRLILSLLGSPQQDCKFILVGGSNGKGSTVEMIGSILAKEGFRAGTYFSPHVAEFSERIRINGRNEGKKEIVAAYLAVRKTCALHRVQATFFEAVTAMALLVFQKRKVDFAVLEVGLGGRLDATNAVEPEISAVTSVSLEHTAVLGRTLAKIAREKAGIARKGRFLACGSVGKEAAHAISAHCKKTGAIMVFAEKEAAISGHRSDAAGRHSFVVRFRGSRYAVRLSAPGEFQVKNACTALAVCSLLGVSKKAIEAGLAASLPKFRLQQLSSSPRVIADCAHNPEAAAALAAEVAEMKGGRRVLLFSAMSDKDYASVLRALAPLFDEVIITQVPLSRSAGLQQLASAAKRAGAKKMCAVKRPAQALEKAKKSAGRPGTVVVAGSIYLLAALFGKDKIMIAQ